MEVQEKNDRRQVVECQKYPTRATEPKKQREEKLGQVRAMMADRNRFAKWLSRSGVPTPRWIGVPKGEKLSALHFDYPVRVKSALSKKPSQVCQNLKAAEKAVASYDEGSHVQQNLTGYTFVKVLVEKGELATQVPPHVFGVIRRAWSLLVSLGASDFELTVAVSSDKRTVYIVP